MNYPRLVPILLALTAAASAQTITPTIRMNSLGFLPEAEKRATIATDSGVFSVLRVDDGVAILSGRLEGPVENPDTDEAVWIADFSSLKKPGRYLLRLADGETSAPFDVTSHVYQDAFRTVTRAMYLWRCGCAVRGEHGGRTYAHAPCHMEDGWMDHATGENIQIDGTGGWHDAGDYNKYVVNAGVTVGAMIRAWEDFEPSIRAIKLDLPESDGPLPEFLAELKWEYDWLLKMQAPDGRVHHKLSTLNFGGFIMPEDEATPRYFTKWSTAATADFVAMMAAGARVFRPHDAAYADRCLAAARKGHAILLAHPADEKGDLTGFRTGRYQTVDLDDRLWAAAELWETTGDESALRDFEARARESDYKVAPEFDWGYVAPLGIITYLHSQRDGRDPAVVAALRDNLLATADGIVATRDAHGYARPLGNVYRWGCNGDVARQTLILHCADRLASRPEYTATALDAVSHLLGRNVHGRSYVTGVGYLPPLQPHDRRSTNNLVDPPWPGYLVGGPQKNARDWEDVQASFRTNEIAINWNGALIYALAWFLPADSP